MEALGRQYGAPLAAAAASRFRRDEGLGAVRSAGRALANTKVRHGCLWGRRLAGSTCAWASVQRGACCATPRH